MIRATIKRHKRQAGLSIVELMIGVTLGLAIMLVVSQTFLSNQRSFRVQGAMARLQENGRLATQLLGHDTRSAGYTGCGHGSNNIAQGITAGNWNSDKFSQTAAPAVNTWLYYDAQQPVLGFTAAAPPPGLAINQVLANTDIVQVQYFDSLNTIMVGAMATAISPLVVSANPLKPPVDGDVLLVSDCLNGTVFRATSVTNGNQAKTFSINHTVATNVIPNLIVPFGQITAARVAEISRLVTNIYFVACMDANSAPTSICASNDSPRYLWRRTLIAGNMISQDMVEGVENMKISYGLNTNAVIDTISTLPAITTYLPANSVANRWRQLRAVQVSFLIRSTENNVATTPQTYKYNGVTTTATDLRIRKVFSTTLAARNTSLENFE